MLLPEKAQRSVTFAEQTSFGERIRYAACAVAKPDVVENIGRIGGPYYSLEMLGEFREDACIVSVLELLESGRRSGLSIDALVPGVPQQIRP